MPEEKDVVIFELAVVVKVEKREDEKREEYYAASTEPFAITAYGDSTEEAHKRALQAVELLLEGYSETPEKLKDYLTRKAVKHNILQTPEPYPIVHKCVLGRKCTQKIRVGVPAGA